MQLVEAQKSPKPILLLERHSGLLILKEYTYYLLMDFFLMKLIMKHACFSLSEKQELKHHKAPFHGRNFIPQPGTFSGTRHVSTLGLNLARVRFFTQEKKVPAPSVQKLSFLELLQSLSPPGGIMLAVLTSDCQSAANIYLELITLETSTRTTKGNNNVHNGSRSIYHT